MQVDGAVAVVIGGGSGIGRGAALGLAAAGSRVVVGDIDPATAAAVAGEIEAAGGRAVSTRVDGTDRGSLDALMRFAVDSYGSVGIVSSNVGVILQRRLDEATEADWAWVIEFNLMSHVRAVDVAVPYLRRTGGPGHIVLTASMAAITVPAGPGLTIGLYNATKHAVLGFGETLRGELAAEQIGVSVLCPGMVASNLGVTSLTHRPERHGGPLEAQDRPPPPGAMPNEEVGSYVVRGVEGNRLLILTHPSTHPLVQRRHDRLTADFEFFAADG